MPVSIFINVDENGDAHPTTTGTFAPGEPQTVALHSNKDTFIKALDNDSPFVGLAKGKGKKIRPAVTLNIKPGIPKMVYKMRCGEMVGSQFKEWGGGGFVIPL